MTEDELDQKLLDAQVRCLAPLSPDDWHRVADAHNWDEPLNILHWIVSQPNCDRSTARLVFWKGEPTGYDFEDCDEDMGDDPYSVEPMLAYIVRRFHAQGYPREEIEFDLFQVKTGVHSVDDPAYATAIVNAGKADFAELRDRSASSALPIPEDLLIAHVPGRRVSKLGDLGPALQAYPVGIDYDSGEFVYFD